MTNSGLQHPAAKRGWSFPLKQFHGKQNKENQKIVAEKLQGMDTRQVNSTGKNFKIEVELFQGNDPEMSQNGY